MQDDLDPGPALTNLGDDAGHLLLCAGRSIDVGSPELGHEQLLAAEDVERQIAVAIVTTMEETAFPVAVDGVVRGIEIEDDLLGRLLMGLREEGDEEIFDSRRIMADTVVAVRARPGRAPGGSRCSCRPRARSLAGGRACKRPRTVPKAGS